MLATTYQAMGLLPSSHRPNWYDARRDVLLESYTVRHQAAHLLEADRAAGLALLRRSHHLRAALGARPQTAAAAVLLAQELPAGAEADGLRTAAALTARELRLTWLLREL